MFISVLDLFKIGIGPSSSHTMGPMVAARDFRKRIQTFYSSHPGNLDARIRCTLRGSLAFTGKGHATDRAVLLGIHGHTPQGLANQNVNDLVNTLSEQNAIEFMRLLRYEAEIVRFRSFLYRLKFVQDGPGLTHGMVAG